MKKQLDSGKAIPAVTTVLVIVLLLTIFAIYYIFITGKQNEEILLEVNEQRALSEQTAKYVLSAANGDVDSFESINESRSRFDESIRELKNLSPESMQIPVREHENLWLEMREAADTVEANKDQISQLSELISVAISKIPGLQSRLGNITRLLMSNAESESSSIGLITRQLQVLERMGRSLDNIFQGGARSAEAIDTFGRDTRRFQAILDAMVDGNEELGVKKIENPEAREELKTLATSYVAFRDIANNIFGLVPDLLSALEAAQNITDISTRLNDSSVSLITRYLDVPGRPMFAGVRVGPWLVYLLGGLAVLIALLLGYLLVNDARNRERETGEQNTQNEEAILRLLDEMADLADGDLTVKATVTENITGAIADSINFTIEELRQLVSTIDSSSKQISISTKNTQNVAQRLTDASKYQANQILAVTQKTEEVRKAMDEMSNHAQDSAEVATKSRAIAGEGGTVVRRTINAMDQARSHIQDTGKRIKRLGESSQQIGEIVELIEDIADQTNLLALNAAMQAANAGEAGKGFAVVADEVQRLAERSVDASRQIEALVKTIQVDTKDAVSSMEVSTSSVVDGAKLAEEAGTSLLQIEEVSDYIADLTRRMSQTAQSQSASVTDVDSTMKSIREITEQTSQGVVRVTASIMSLSNLADRLQQTVSGFRLPETVQDENP
ncbi:MAG: methyl-accepting chemotaxis protein [Chromatiales bacterium]|jgi:twitching motility protein PilJ